MDYHLGVGVQDADRPGQKPAEYHPQFCDVIKDADKAVTLMSSDNVKFLVHSTILRISSAFFQALLSLPQPEKSEDVIHCLDEDSTTVEGILRIITGKEFPNLSTMKEITPIALTAEKWEMREVLSILRMLLLRDLTLASETPIDLYWLACRLKWDDVLKLASKYSCDKDVYTGPTLHPSLSRLDPVDVLRLLKFHRERRDAMATHWVTSGPKNSGKHCFTHLGSETEKCLIQGWLVTLVENHPAPRPPTRADIEQSVILMMRNGSVCSNCRKYSLNEISQFFLDQWARLPKYIGDYPSVRHRNVPPGRSIRAIV